MPFAVARSGAALLRRDFGSGARWLSCVARLACRDARCAASRAPVLEAKLRGSSHAAIAREQGVSVDHINRLSRSALVDLGLDSCTDALRLASVGGVRRSRPCVLVAGGGRDVEPVVRHLERLGCDSCRASTLKHACDVALSLPTIPFVVVLPAVADRSHTLVADLLRRDARIVVVLAKRRPPAREADRVTYVCEQDFDTIARLVLLETTADSPRAPEAETPEWFSDWSGARAVYEDTLANAGELDEPTLRELVRAWLDTGTLARAARVLHRSPGAIDSRSRQLRRRLAIQRLELLAWRIGVAIDGWTSADIEAGRVEPGVLPTSSTASGHERRPPDA